MRIPFSFLLLLLVFAEIAVFILVGEAIGVLATLGLTLFAMIAGAALLRRQGVATLMRIRADAAAGRLPARPLVEGAVLAIAALLMIVPGFITDAVGILLFIPPVRAALLGRFRRAAGVRTAQAQFRPPPAKVVELGEDEYASTRPRPDTPWRPGER